MSSEDLKTILLKYYHLAYMDALKEYQSRRDGSSNYEYAEEYFSKKLFLNNAYEVRGSILFYFLREKLIHFTMLDKENALSNLISEFDLIVVEVKKELGKLRANSEFKQNEIIHDFYVNKLLEGRYSMYELEAIEQKQLSRNKEEILKDLMGDYACKSLYVSMTKKKEFQEIQKIEINQQYKFTRAEQVLCYYYFLLGTGINPHAVDRTKHSKFLHLLSGIGYDDPTKMKNTSFYKLLSKVPQVVNDDKLLIKYLKNILPYFEDLLLDKSVELIIKQINQSQNELIRNNKL